jgi:hypothetical protein
MKDCEALEAAEPGVKGEIKQLIDGSHEAEGACDNLDLAWNRIQNTKMAR